MPHEMAKSRFEWLTYNEPEGHLDAVVEHLSHLPGVSPNSRVVGLTYKDDTTLARLGRQGFGNTFRYDPRGDLSLDDPCAGLESIQKALDERTATQLVRKYGQADLLLARHILEHAHDPAQFLRAIRMLVKPLGYVLFEVPDCTKFIRACDYSFIWEEHITYLCEPTLNGFIAQAGMRRHETLLHPYPLEDSLIAIAENEATSAQWKPPQQEPLDRLIREGNTFAAQYPPTRERVQSLFRQWRAEGKRVAMFGAGHLAAKFANMYGVGHFVDCVIDDNPQKQALLMPGSRMAIRGSVALEVIDLCLLSLSPESEQKVVAKNRAFVERGGRFLSIFALSPNSLYAARTP
jgi:hypothetical protein